MLFLPTLLGNVSAPTLSNTLTLMLQIYFKQISRYETNCMSKMAGFIMSLIKSDITSILLLVINVVLFNNSAYFGLEAKNLVSFLKCIISAFNDICAHYFFSGKNGKAIIVWYFLNHINPFIPNAPFIYPLKTPENLTVFWCFQGVEKGCIGYKWINSYLKLILKIAWLHLCLTLKILGKRLWSMIYVLHILRK